MVQLRADMTCLLFEKKKRDFFIFDMNLKSGSLDIRISLCMIDKTYLYQY